MSEESEASADGAAIEAAWIEEARRRLQEIKAGRVEPAPWSEARERIFAHEVSSSSFGTKPAASSLAV